MTTVVSRHNGVHQPHHLHQWANVFEITNLADLTINYQLLEIQGLPAGEYFDKSLNRLVKSVAYDVKQPVALIRQADTHFLALPVNVLPSCLEQPLMPHVASLVPSERIYTLDFARLDAQTLPIAAVYLKYALRTPLMHDPTLWGSGLAYYRKHSLNATESRSAIDIYPGFKWSVITTGEQRFLLAVDPIVRFIDRAWLPERLTENDPQPFMMRHCLYQFGHKWFIVQLRGLTNRSIAEQRFSPHNEERVVDVFTYTQEQCSEPHPSWIRDLDPESPAIVYRYPGNEQDRYGALGLCKLTLSTADADVARFHRYSIQDPADRLTDCIDVVKQHFQQARLGDQRIRVAQVPQQVERKLFLMPPQRFGHGRILAVQPTSLAEATDVVPLDQFGQRRLQLLLDRSAGPLDVTPFGAQYILVPQSLPRAINEDLIQRFERAMRDLSGQSTYRIQRILYDDRQASSLYRQVQAIKDAIRKNGITHGYVLLVLPERTNRDLHNYIKRDLWPDLQFQCAMASKIRGYYEPCQGLPAFRPASRLMGKLTNYIRNCALGMMVLNRKWGWSLATPLHYDVYIGIDVLNRMAGVTFVYNQGQQMFFRNHPCKQPERLTKPQLREVLVKHLRHDLGMLRLQPRSIIIHRDGRTFASELDGIHAAMKELKREGVLPSNTIVGVVDIRKTTADSIRLFEGASLEAVQNPVVGSYYVLDQRTGYICTTGRPFRFPGTAKPLTAVVVEGDLTIEWVLEDLFALAQPVFTAPDKCARLPVTIKLADDFLEPIAYSVPKNSDTRTTRFKVG